MHSGRLSTQTPTLGHCETDTFDKEGSSMHAVKPFPGKPTDEDLSSVSKLLDYYRRVSGQGAGQSKERHDSGQFEGQPTSFAN